MQASLKTSSFLHHRAAIPTKILSQAINYLCSGWYTLLSYNPWDGLFSLSALSPFFNALLLLCTLAIAYTTLRMPARKGALWCLACTISFYSLLHLHDLARHGVMQLSDISPGLLLLYKNKSTALIQHGTISTSVHNTSWIQYSLLPTIIKNSGSAQITYLIITHINRHSCTLAYQLIAHNAVKHIITIENTRNINPIALQWACKKADIPYCHIKDTHAIYKIVAQYIVQYT